MSDEELKHTIVTLDLKEDIQYKNYLRYVRSHIIRALTHCNSLDRVFLVRELFNELNAMVKTKTEIRAKK